MPPAHRLLTFGGAGNISVGGIIDGIIDGIAPVIKDGAGTLTLTGTNAYTGDTNVDEGTLVVGVGGSGSIVSDVTVGGAGTLKGTGSTGGVTVESGGVHAPGNSIGTQLVVAIFGQSAEGARQAFDALSGEVHASVGAVLTNDSRFIRRTIFNRLQQASANTAPSGMQVAANGTSGPSAVAGGSVGEPMALGLREGRSPSDPEAPAAASPLVFWTQGFGSWGNFDGNRNAATANRTIGGFLSGADAGLGGGWRAGLALGYSNTSVSIDARDSSAGIDGYHLSLYAGGAAGAVALRGGGAWSWNNIDANRTIAFPAFLERVDTSYNSDVGQLFGEAALPLGAGSIAYEPFANIAYVHLSTDGFIEQGGIAALDGNSGSDNTGFGTLGMRLAASTAFGDARIVPRASLAWQHAFGDVNPLRALAFTGSTPFGIAGVPLARNAALIDVGFDAFLAPDATLSFSYNGQLAGDIEDHGVSGRLNWRF